MDKILFESKAWKIVDSEGEIYLINKRFEAEGRFHQYTEVTAETVETCEIQGVKIPKYIREALAAMFVEPEAEAVKTEVTVHDEMVIVENKHGQHVLNVGETYEITTISLGEKSSYTLEFLSAEGHDLKFKGNDGFGWDFIVKAPKLYFAVVEKLPEEAPEEVTVEIAYEAAPYEAKLSIDGELEAEEKDLHEVDLAFLVKNVAWTMEKLQMDINEAEDPEELTSMRLDLKLCKIWFDYYEPKARTEETPEEKIKLFARYEELLNKSLSKPFHLEPEEQKEYNRLYDELELENSENLYTLMKMKYEFVK